MSTHGIPVGPGCALPLKTLCLPNSSPPELDKLSLSLSNVKMVWLPPLTIFSAPTIFPFSLWQNMEKHIIKNHTETVHLPLASEAVL